MANRIPNVSPGKMLREEFLEPLGITPYRLAKDIGVPPTRIHAILNEERGVTADTAIRLGQYFGMSPEFWLNLQASFELHEIRDLAGGLNIKPLQRPTAKERETLQNEVEQLVAA